MLKFSDNRFRDAILSIFPFLIAGLILLSIEKSTQILWSFFLIFWVVCISVTIYAFKHNIPMWTLPYLGFMVILPFSLMYVWQFFVYYFILFIVILLLTLYKIAKQNLKNWLLFFLPLSVLWAFWMCDGLHPLSVALVQTIVIVFCVVAMFELIHTRLKWYYPVIISGVIIYTGLYIYITFYAPFSPGSLLSSTHKNNYIGITPTLLGYFIPGLIVISGPVSACIKQRKVLKAG